VTARLAAQGAIAVLRCLALIDEAGAERPRQQLVRLVDVVEIIAAGVGGQEVMVEAGVVADSDPDAELRETELKLGAMLETLRPWRTLDSRGTGTEAKDSPSRRHC
jgi:hypothetical protein